MGTFWGQLQKKWGYFLNLLSGHTDRNEPRRGGWIETASDERIDETSKRNE